MEFIDRELHCFQGKMESQFEQKQRMKRSLFQIQERNFL